MTDPRSTPTPHPQWAPWHYVNLTISRSDLESILGLLRSFPVPWFVCGGWAIDLFAGDQSREHSDLEVGVFRDDQAEIRRQFGDWNLGKVVDAPNGAAIVPWHEGEWLLLPIHQVKLYRDGFQPREFEFFLNEADERVWHFRRMPEITMPKDRLIRATDDGIFYVAPEVQLLYKSRIMRDQDRADFALAVPLMDAEQRGWLASALERFLPGHVWLSML